MKDDTIIIRTRGLSRSYRKTVKAEGLSGSLRALFHKRAETVPALGGAVAKALGGALAKALCDFDLELRRGEMLGVIGPNGAGKTTLVKMLSGIMRPSSGELEVLGHSPRAREEAFLSRMALVMGQKSQLWWDLPASDSFLLNKAIYRIPEAKYRASLARLASSLEVEHLLGAPVRSLSLGERMRMEFIAAMLHEPDIVFLDEPTIGLDAPAQKRIREFLRRENAERGMTLVLTSHYMDDIRRLCPRTVLILKGRKAYDGDTETLFADTDDSADIADTVERIYGGQV
jgi:ABC-2 type transport system ATP-binding protein